LATSLGDLADDDLSYLLTRLNRLFEQRDAWPYLGLQYRMGEVGQNRIEPRKLRRALAELVNNRRPRRGKLRMPGPWEPVPWIFAAPDMTLEEAYHVSVAALERTQPLAGLDHDDTLDGLRAVVEGATGTFVLGQRASEPLTVKSGPRAGGIAFSRTLDLTCRVRPVTLWLTHETEWLYPDDPSLWAFLGRCVSTNSRPLIVARHTGMDAGRPWEVTIKQWNAWGTYRPRRTGLPKGGISEVLKKTSVGRAPQPPNALTTEELPAGDGERWTFGRDTEISRVPIRLK
jgi:hypothetical protein